MKPLRLVISGFWFSFVVIVIALALLLSAARILLPAVGEYRDEVARLAGELVGQPVRIGEIRAGWHGWGPSVKLRDVEVLDAAGQQAVLRCDAARIDMNVWRSLLERQFEPGKLTVSGMSLSLIRREDGSIAAAGLGGAQGEMDEHAKRQLMEWLQRQDRLAIEESSVRWTDLMDGGSVWEFGAVNLQLRNHGQRHRIDGDMTLPDALGRSLQIAINIQGDLFTPARWQGQAYLQGKALHLDAMAGEWRAALEQSGLAAVNGTADFMAWSDWQDGVNQVEGDLHISGLRLIRAVEDPEVNGRQVEIAGLDGNYRWQRVGKDWTLDLEHLVVNRQQSVSPPAQLRVQYKKDEVSDERIFQAAFSAARIEDVAGIMGDGGLGPAGLRERLAVMAPQGVAHDGYLRYQVRQDQPPQWVLRAAFDNAAVHAAPPLPGVTGLTGRITANEQYGVAALATQKSTVDFANLFRAPLALDGVAGGIYWQNDGQQLRVLATNVAAFNEDIKVQLAFSLDAPRDGGTPYLDLTVNFAEGNGVHMSRYLPAKIMHPTTVDWLDRAVVTAKVSDGTARLVGPLAAFPFDDGRGLFEIRFNVHDGILEYAPGWPRLEEIEAEALFRGRRMEINAVAAKSLSSEITQAKAVIADMTAKPALLAVTGKARGPTADALRYLRESPLHDRFGVYFDEATAGGSSRLSLKLNVPLTAHAPVQVQGDLQIADGSLVMKGADIDITRINGNLHFSDQGISADGIQAVLLGQAVTVAAKTTAGTGGAMTIFSAEGTADAATMAKRFAPPLASYVAGTAPWHGELRIPPKKEGWVELEVASPLQGVTVQLPPPLAKAAETTSALLVQMPLPIQDDKPVHIRYGDIVDAQLALQRGAGGMTLARGEVMFGGGMAALVSQPGLRLTGKLDEFDEAQWRPVLWPETAESRGTGAAGLRQLDMEIATLKALGRQLTGVHVQAGRGDGMWNVDLASDQAAGRITLPDAEDATLTLDMQRLYLPRFKKGGGGGDAPDTAGDPRKFHPMLITARDFRYGDLALGELTLRASRQPAGLSFDEIHAHSERRDLKINGTWTVGEDGPLSSFAMTYNGEDAGATLAALNFADMIKGGKVHTEMRLQWRGAPQGFALAKAAGTIGFQIEDGRLLEVEPGAGRILGLLSFQALPRRLLLDFSDLFQKGFSFDRVAGSFTIENGDARTDNLRMEGPSANIEVRGRVGLVNEDYDQRVTVIPNVTGGLPVAGVIAGGVGAGAVLLLAEKLLKPGIDKMTQAEYRVTGPWANPVVERTTEVEQNKPPEGKAGDQ